MARTKGKWYDGVKITYSDDDCVVKIRSSMWWVGVALVTSLTIMLVGSPDEVHKCLSLLKPWFSLLQLGSLVVMYLVGFALVSWSVFSVDRASRTYRIALIWLGVPIRKYTGTFEDIECVQVQEHIKDEDSHHFHLYIRAKGYNHHFYELSKTTGMPEARRLAAFIGCPLVMTDKTMFQEGTYEYVESLEEVKRKLSASDVPLTPGK